MISVLLIILLVTIAIMDVKMFRIMNVIVYPAIGIALFHTGYWIETLTAFTVMALLLKDEEKKWGLLNWCGGDVKLFMLIAAFKGWLFIPVLIGTELFIRLYRWSSNYKFGLPVTPFCLASSITFMSIAVALRWIGH